MVFSPAMMQQNFLIAGSWDNSVSTLLRSRTEWQNSAKIHAVNDHTNFRRHVCWSDDGTNVFMASCDKQVKCWGLGSYKTVQVAAHDAPIKTCHWFWDVRSSVPMMTINLPEGLYCADVDYPMAVVSTASKGIVAYKLEVKPEIVKSVDSLLKYQHCCVAIFRDKKNKPLQVLVWEVKKDVQLFIIYNHRVKKNNFTFKSHRQNNSGTMNVLDIFYVVNVIKFHPDHSTLAAVGSDA